MDVNYKQIKAFSDWLGGGQITSDNVEPLLEVDQTYNIPPLLNDIKVQCFKSRS